MRFRSAALHCRKQLGVACTGFRFDACTSKSDISAAALPALAPKTSLAFADEAGICLGYVCAVGLVRRLVGFRDNPSRRAYGCRVASCSQFLIHVNFVDAAQPRSSSVVT